MLKVMVEECPELSVEEDISDQKLPEYGGFKFNNYRYHKGMDGVTTPAYSGL